MKQSFKRRWGRSRRQKFRSELRSLAVASCDLKAVPGELALTSASNW